MKAKIWLTPDSFKTVVHGQESILLRVEIDPEKVEIDRGKGEKQTFVMLSISWPSENAYPVFTLAAPINEELTILWSRDAEEQLVFGSPEKHLSQVIGEMYKGRKFVNTMTSARVEVIT